MNTNFARSIITPAAVVILLVLYLSPTAYSSLISFYPKAGSAGSITLKWYAEMLRDDRLAKSVIRSLWASLAIASLTTAFCTLAIATLRQHLLKFQRLLVAVILLPLFVPETTHALTLADFLAEYGIAKGWWALLLGVSVYILPFTSIIILLSISDIPPNLDLASKDMGMTTSARLLRVTVPLIWVACAFAFLFSFILAFNEHARTAYFESGEMYSVYLRGNITGGGGQAVYAVSTSMSLSGLILLTILYRKQKRRSEERN